MAHKLTDIDFTVQDGGSVYLLTPQTEAAREWRKQYLPVDVQMLGRGIAVEWRYIDRICAGIMDDGLTVGRV